MLAFLSLFVLLPWFVVGAWRSGALEALAATAYVAALSVSLLMLCLLQFLGFELFTRAGAALGTWMVNQPLSLLLLPAAMLAAREWNRRRRNDAREAGELLEGLTFDSLPPPTVERLDLSGTG